MLPRRQLLQLAFTGAALAGAAHSAPAVAAHQPLDLGLRSAQDDLLIWAKLKADLSGRTVYAVTTGTVWGFKPQADDLPLVDFSRRLYGYRSCVARQARLNKDGTVSIKSRSWNFYLDAGSGQFVTELLNPYTGKTVKSAPMIGPAAVQNYSTAGLLDFKPAYPVEQLTPSRPFDLHISVVNDHAFVTESSFIRLKPGNISWWKLEGTMTSHSCQLRDLREGSRTHTPSSWSQNLVAEWQTWMEMHGTPGHILFKGDGCPVYSAAELPPELQRDIESVSPGGLADINKWS